MSAEQSFPLFRLPTVALSEVLRNYDPCELVSLSFCSRNARKAAKSYRYKSAESEIFLVGGETPSVSFDRFLYPKETYDRFVISYDQFPENKATKRFLKIGEFVVPFSILQNQTVYGQNEFTTYWERDLAKESIITLASYICDLFKLPIHDALIDIRGTWLIDWIYNRQEEQLGSVSLCNQSEDRITNEEYEVAIKKFRPIDYFSLDFPQSPYTGKFPDADQLVLYDAQSFTIENLMSIKSSSIEIYDSKFTIDDLKTYLQHWINGNNFCLKYISFLTMEDLDVQHIDVPKLFEFFGDRAIKRDQNRYFVISNDYHDLISHDHSFDIQREDGMVITVANDEIFVWPDLRGTNADNAWADKK